MERLRNRREQKDGTLLNNIGLWPQKFALMKATQALCIQIENLINSHILSRIYVYVFYSITCNKTRDHF